MVILRYLCILPRMMVIFKIFHILLQCHQECQRKLWINVQHLQVVNVSEYGELFIINNFVHDAPIIFVSMVARLF